MALSNCLKHKYVWNQYFLLFKIHLSTSCRQLLVVIRFAGKVPPRQSNKPTVGIFCLSNQLILLLRKIARILMCVRLPQTAGLAETRIWVWTLPKIRIRRKINVPWGSWLKLDREFPPFPELIFLRPRRPRPVPRDYRTSKTNSLRWKYKRPIFFNIYSQKFHCSNRQLTKSD